MLQLLHFSYIRNVKLSKFLFYILLNKFETLNPVVGRCQVTLRGCKSGIQVWVLKSFCFWDMAFFYDFFFQKFRYKKTNRSWNSQLYTGVLSRCLQLVANLRRSMTAQILLVFEIWRFLWFYFFFQKTFFCQKRQKKLTELEVLNPIVRYCQGKLLFRSSFF